MSRRRCGAGQTRACAGPRRAHAPAEPPSMSAGDGLRRLGEATCSRQASERGAESTVMVVLGIDPGLANTGYGVVARRGDGLVALDGGVITTPAGIAQETRPGRHPRSRRRPARRACARRSRAGGALLRPERAHRLRGRPRARGGDAGGRPARHCRAPATRRRRSRARSAATAAPRRSRSHAWSRRCWGSPTPLGQTTPPTRSPSRSATQTARRCRARSPGSTR